MSLSRYITYTFKLRIPGPTSAKHYNKLTSSIYCTRIMSCTIGYLAVAPATFVLTCFRTLGTSHWARVNCDFALYGNKASSSGSSRESSLMVELKKSSPLNALTISIGKIAGSSVQNALAVETHVVRGEQEENLHEAFESP